MMINVDQLLLSCLHRTQYVLVLCIPQNTCIAYM